MCVCGDCFLRGRERKSQKSTAVELAGIFPRPQLEGKGEGMMTRRTLLLAKRQKLGQL